MWKPTLGPLGRRKRVLLVIFLILLVQPCACEKVKESKERQEEIREEIRMKVEGKNPIGRITTTNYCSGRITASDMKVRPGYIALSRDIVRQHKLKFGDLIYLEGETEPYIFEDTMPPQWHRHADLYSRICRNAKEYGVQKRMLWFVTKPE